MTDNAVHETQSITPVYSPGQIAFGSFLGGPLAMIYFLMSNFGALGQKVNQFKTIVFGGGAVVLMLYVLPDLPDGVPASVFSVVYALIGMNVAAKMQMTRDHIADSKEHDFQSNWRVIAITLLCFVVFLAFVVDLNEVSRLVQSYLA